MHEHVYTLPGGYFDPNGRLHREVALRALGGYEEELLSSQHLSPAKQVTQLLQRCITRIGDITVINEDVTKQLFVADREYLLLMLRKITFGNKVQAKLACPWPDCLKNIDIDFNIDEVPITTSGDTQQQYSCAIYDETQDRTHEYTFRLPSGRDQEMISEEIGDSEACIVNHLLSSCLLRIDGESCIDAETVRGLSASIRNRLEQEIEKNAPNIDLCMELSCPECSRSFVAPFELQDFFFGEIKTNIELLYREIHYLAFHYHWSEAELLSMPRSKRRRYIDILSSEIEKINDKAN